MKEIFASFLLSDFLIPLYSLNVKFIPMNKNIKKILTNPFLISIFAVILLSVGLFFGTLRWLGSYTNHGKEIFVPDLRGLNEEETGRILTSKKLRYEIIDSIFVRGEKAGVVMEQNPEAGARVKEDRKIYLIINARSPRKVILPDLRDVSLRQAEAIIISLGLKVGGYEYVPSEYKNLIQNVKYGDLIAPPGTRITEGASVILMVGQGLSSETTKLVSFRELTLEQARARAHSFSLNIGATLFDEPPKNEKDRELFFVYRQEPITGTEVSLGQSINLFLTKNSALLEIPEETVEEDPIEEEPWEY
jgi:beta-lactam-binding protein with PASTA domain